MTDCRLLPRGWLPEKWRSSSRTAAPLPRWPPRQRLRQYRSSLPSAMTRSNSAWSPAWANPEGNITGVTLFMNGLAPERLELLAERVPRAPLTILVNAQNPNAKTEARDASEAAG